MSFYDLLMIYVWWTFNLLELEFWPYTTSIWPTVHCRGSRWRTKAKTTKYIPYQIGSQIIFDSLQSLSNPTATGRCLEGVAGGGWWLEVAGGGRWWWVVGGGRWWWVVVGFGGHGVGVGGWWVVVVTQTSRPLSPARRPVPPIKKFWVPPHIQKFSACFAHISLHMVKTFYK